MFAPAHLPDLHTLSLEDHANSIEDALQLIRTTSRPHIHVALASSYPQVNEGVETVENFARSLEEVKAFAVRNTSGFVASETTIQRLQIQARGDVPIFNLWIGEGSHYAGSREPDISLRVPCFFNFTDCIPVIQEQFGPAEKIALHLVQPELLTGTTSKTEQTRRVLSRLPQLKTITFEGVRLTFDSLHATLRRRPRPDPNPNTLHDLDRMEFPGLSTVNFVGVKIRDRGDRSSVANLNHVLKTRALKGHPIPKIHFKEIHGLSAADFEEIRKGLSDVDLTWDRLEEPERVVPRIGHRDIV
ncbi:hypothetical protein DFP72DRAFT_50121 [Ephemerocybe angulata]|uniref:Uncharacterized protein n=1 Tax=Ephemerocybe angulata TaxID=980116 RepID=A0A8H6LY29_9AGAR|nr:hypothetical protein DFP72DRAFT_50121 [Tulosesus angulatus]